MKKICLLLFALALLSFAYKQKTKTKVYLIGDSTMSIKETKVYPETGWGMPFAYFFDSTIEVDNRAKNGRSTRTFISENRWQPLADNLQEGDYVFIQFGHNDESKEKTDRYTTPEQFKINLTKFVTETRAKKASPILITAVARRKFDSTNHVVDGHGVYTEIVRELAKELDVPMIDLQKTSTALLEKMGKENSKLLFLQLEKNEHPNYPDGKEDNTHFNELGARKIAQLVLQDMTNLKLDLVNHIVKPAVKK
ncbi:MAG: rhamnogalacturonan acetylesterase [Bacteroidetes bacterium]|nr:rhamnogalacturonan acetylesterase [Bacteroidota bacterium]